MDAAPPRREHDPHRQVHRQAHEARHSNEGVKYPNNYAGGWTRIGNFWPKEHPRGEWFPGIV